MNRLNFTKIYVLKEDITVPYFPKKIIKKGTRVKMIGIFPFESDFVKVKIYNEIEKSVERPIFGFKLQELLKII